MKLLTPDVIKVIIKDEIFLLNNNKDIRQFFIDKEIPQRTENDEIVYYIDNEEDLIDLLANNSSARIQISNRSVYLSKESFTYFYEKIKIAEKINSAKFLERIKNQNKNFQMERANDKSPFESWELGGKLKSLYNYSAPILIEKLIKPLLEQVIESLGEAGKMKIDEKINDMFQSKDKDKEQ